MTAVLLVETTQGAYVGVTFPSVEAAREWEDEHGLVTMGCVEVVSRTEALKLADIR